MSTNDKCIVYGLSHSGNPDCVRYVGQTIQPLFRRLRTHKIHAKSTTKHTPVGMWITAKQAQGHTILIRPLIKSANWNTCEQAFIAGYLAMGGRLLNVTAGGQGHRGHKMSDEQKAKISKALKGRKKPPGFAEMRRQARLGVKASKETRELLTKIHTGQKHSTATCEKFRKRMMGNTLASRVWTEKQCKDRSRIAKESWAKRKAQQEVIHGN
jgi:NUMOD3 motif